MLTEINTVLDTVPNHTQECRYRFLRAQCIGWLDGRVRGRDNYIAALQEVTASCDSSDQGWDSRRLKSSPDSVWVRGDKKDK